MIVQTLDEEGVRFKLGQGDWVTLPPIPNSDFKDPQGAGDWFTSSFIYALGKFNLLSVDKMTEANLSSALMFAQEVASRSVSFVGAKTMIYNDPDFKEKVNAPRDVNPNQLAQNDFIELTKKDIKKPVEKLDDIPAKDYREYDITHAHAYRSDYDCINGVETHLSRRDCNPLSNFYECNLRFNDMEFFSAEQLYHYLKFTGNEALQEDILQCSKSKEVMHLCHGKEGCPDHDRTRWMHMTLALEVKYIYCKKFRDIVRNSGELPIVEVQEAFDVHGATVKGTHKLVGGTYKNHDVSNKYVGMNGCGRCMMAVREKFRNIDVEKEDYQMNFTTLDEWWNASPIYQQLLDRMGKN